MRGARVLLSLVCLSVLLASGAPAVAFQEDMELIASHTLLSGDWATFRFQVSERTEVAIGDRDEPESRYSYAAVADWLLTDEGESRGSSLRLSWAGRNLPDVYLHTDATGTVVREETGQERSGNLSSYSSRSLDPGTYIAAATASARGSAFSVTIELLSTGSVELLEVSSGAGGFLYTEEDFGGSATVVVDSGLVGAHAMAEGSAQASSEHSMFAWFLVGGLTGLTEAGVESPDGGWGCISWLFGCFTTIDGESAGAYTFSVNGSVMAGGLFPRYITAVGADIPLP